MGMFTLKVPGRPVEKLTLGIPGRPGRRTVKTSPNRPRLKEIKSRLRTETEKDGDLHRAAATVRVPGPADSPAAHPSGLPPRALPRPPHPPGTPQRPYSPLIPRTPPRCLPPGPPRSRLVPPIPHPQEPAVEPPQLLPPSAYKPRGSPFGLSYIHAALVTLLFPRASFSLPLLIYPPTSFRHLSRSQMFLFWGGGGFPTNPLSAKYPR